MIISISGLPGSGKSTIAKMLAVKYGWERIYSGAILRKMAENKGITILDLMKEAETDSSIDEEVDNFVADLGRSKDNFIIESRTAFHFIPDSFKVFVKVDLNEGAKRIFKDLDKEERANEEKASSANELANKLRERVEVDRRRYLKYYGVDFTQESNYDLVVDSSEITADEVLEKIVAEADKYQSSISSE